jgi:DNA-binding NarL/FixJ family response regulator
VSKTPTRALIVADRDLAAATVEAALRDRSGLEISVGHPHALRQLIETRDPAVVVLISTTARVAAALQSLAGMLRVLPLVLVVDDPAAAWTAAARRVGVRAVIAQDAGAEQIDAAIAGATAGLITLHPDVLRVQAASARSADTEDDRTLTTRQHEILEMMAAGLSNRLIATRLGISTYTVKFHVAAILEKLGAGTRTEAVTYGVRHGLISL